MERIHIAAEAERQMGFAAAVRVDGQLHVSGVVSWNENFEPLHGGDMRAQMDEVYSRIATFLQSMGSGLGSIIHETVFVTDIEAALACLDARNSKFETDRLPAATMVEVRRLVHPDLMIEVQCTAQVDSAREI